MNKSDLISAMAAEAQMSKADAKKALDAFITSVTNAMKAGDKVSLVGFGTFSVSERAERTGINPSTKATIIPSLLRDQKGDEGIVPLGDLGTPLLLGLYPVLAAFGIHRRCGA